jgi:hypothetical protein
MDLKKDDRIEMISMQNDPDPIPPGTKGTVQYVGPTPWNETQVGVKWDNGRTLSVLLPHDSIRKI